MMAANMVTKIDARCAAMFQKKSAKPDDSTVTDNLPTRIDTFLFCGLRFDCQLDISANCRFVRQRQRCM